MLHHRLHQYINAVNDQFHQNFKKEEIKEFDDLLLKLKKTDLGIQPPFTGRISIGPGKMNPKEGGSIRRILRAGASHANHSWQRKVILRRLFSTSISLLTSITLFYISIASFSSLLHSELIKYLFGIIYFVLTYNATSSLFKIFTGNFIALKDKKYKKITFREKYYKDTKVAILYPVYHEDPAHVVANIMAIWEDLGNIKDVQNHYDFFILSDSRSYKSRVMEEEAIILAKQKIKNINLYYRWRSINVRAKLGNMMDFLRRYSRRYKYIIAMDADSLMGGMAIHQMVSIAEEHDEIGIIQTNPRLILRSTIFGRIFQFSSWAYSTPFFRATRHYYLGDAFYVGHNALLRVGPFRKYCNLPELSGDPPWGGKPLSHDLVEAGLMAKAGYEVWFLPEIQESYEEIPSNIIAFLIRERRWMQGNLQNIRVALGFGLKNAHRDLLVSGFMSYFSSILWFIMIVITVATNIDFDVHYHVTIAIINVQLNTMLMLSYIFILLFLPRIVGMSFVIFQKEFDQFGGFFWFLLSCFIDTLFSMLLAPIIMIFVVKFFIMWLKSIPVKWGTQDRGDDVLPWKDCFNEFALPLVIGMIIFMLVKLNDFPLIWDGNDFYNFFVPSISLGNRYLWFLPIIVALVFSPFVARFSSFTIKNPKFAKLFMIPEETKTSNIILRMEYYLKYLEDTLPHLNDEKGALLFAYMDPIFFIYHYQIIPDRKTNNILKSFEHTHSVDYDVLKKAFYCKSDFAYCHYNFPFK